MDILFYSNKNDLSKTVLYLINSKKINNIKTINIDRNIKIPKCIKVVPTLYIYKTKQFIIDDNIVQFITNIKNEEQPSNSTPDLYENSSIENDYSLDDFFKSTSFTDIKSIATKANKNTISEQDLNSLINKRKNDISY